jgi:hypothetical protein
LESVHASFSSRVFGAAAASERWQSLALQFVEGTLGSGLRQLVPSHVNTDGILPDTGLDGVMTGNLSGLVTQPSPEQATAVPIT